jgi:hypothetical protein
LQPAGGRRLGYSRKDAKAQREKIRGANVKIGKLTRVPLRDVWKHEAADFTTWLEENFDVLNEVLDFNLSST